MEDIRVVIKEQSMRDLADVLREKSGTNTLCNVDELADLARGIGMPPLEELTATENKEYKPSAYGYSKVTVNVQPELEELTLTSGGTYIPTKYGFSKVIADIPVYKNFEEVEF
jgi:hypothetical protein